MKYIECLLCKGQFFGSMYDDRDTQLYHLKQAHYITDDTAKQFLITRSYIFYRKGDTEDNEELTNDSVFINIEEVSETLRLKSDPAEIVNSKVLMGKIHDHKIYAIKVSIIHNDRFYQERPKPTGIWLEFDPDEKISTGKGLFLFRRPRDQ